MKSRIEHGYLALADISGFTHFVAESELEHAHDILAELMELLVERLKPLLRLVEIEGDAVYVYSEDRSILSGEILVDLYEATYVSFRDRVEGIRQHTTCTCNACRLIPTLDLKFVTHYGEYFMQNVAEQSKPVGNSVNLVHRLVKNHVCEVTGWNAYALFSGDAVEHLRLPVEGLHHQVETYEHLGSVNTYNLDLHQRYAAIKDARRVIVTPEQADAMVEIDLPAPPPIVWEWLNDPQRRGAWQGLRIHVEKTGRRGTGTRNHCLHGKKAATIQTVLDWRPFDYFTFETQDAGKSKPDMHITHWLEPKGDGTHLAVRMRLLAPFPALARKALALLITKAFHIEENYRNLQRLLGEAGSVDQGL